MTPEMLLAKALGYDPTEQEKVASAMDSLSIEELEQLLRKELTKTASPKKTKKAEMVKWADELGRGLAKEAAKKEKKEKKERTDRDRAEEWSNRGARLGGMAGGFGTKALGNAPANVAVGAMTGYGAGRLAHRLVHGPVRNEKLKESSIKMALSLGSLGGMAAKGLAKASPHVGRGLNAAVANPLGKRMAVGAGVGAAAGALKDPGMGADGRPNSRIGGMISGAALGAGAGAAAKPLAQNALKMDNRAGKYLRAASRRGTMKPV